ncbi:MAG TPA: hypothetical protein VFS09_10485 [Candidatus Eisenbacteria bacterium]|nr:hypothetical protein [Candidatus Eisenbacteria bacterium]
MLRVAKTMHGWILGLAFVAEIVIAGAGGLMFLAAFVGLSGWAAVIAANRWKRSFKVPRVVEITSWALAPVGALAAIGLLYRAAFGNLGLRSSLPIYALSMILIFVSLLAGLAFDPFPGAAALAPSNLPDSKS